jgi:uncharacterized protein YutE (UPF0331/DUF86 family)
MDEDLILSKFESLSRCLARIVEKTPATADELKKDIDRQDIIAVNLERAVQICVDIGLHIISQRNRLLPDSMAETFLSLAELGVIDKQTAAVMGKTVGFRNTAVHAYRTINWDIVFSICTRHLDDFRSFTRQILAAMEKGETV